MLSLGRRLAQLIEQRPMCRGFILAAADPGSTPGPGTICCMSLSPLTPFPVSFFSCTPNKAINTCSLSEMTCDWSKVCNQPRENYDSSQVTIKLKGYNGILL